MATMGNNSPSGNAADAEPDAENAPGHNDADGAPHTVTPPPARASQRRPWLAEALSIAAIMFAGAALVGTRLAETLAVVTGGASDQLAVYVRILSGDGATAGVGALLAGLALVTSSTESRPWVRALSVATLIVTGIALVVVVVTFFLTPSPQPQPPGIG